MKGKRSIEERLAGMAQPNDNPEVAMNDLPPLSPEALDRIELRTLEKAAATPNRLLRPGWVAAASILLVLMTGLGAATAAGLGRHDLYEALKQTLHREMLKLENETGHSPEASATQSLKVKELSLKVGQLENELYPDPARDFEMKLLAFKAGVGDSWKWCRTMAVPDPECAKGMELRSRKLAVLNRLEAEYAAGTRPVAELLAELNGVTEME